MGENLMKERFEGERNKRLLIDALKSQKVVGGNQALAIDIADKVVLMDIATGDELIVQNDETTDIFFILMGTFQIIINDRYLYDRGVDELVGEMTAVQPSQVRSATVIAKEQSVVARLSEEDFSAIGERYPQVYKSIAQVLAKRLLQRNTLISAKHDKPIVFVISSQEAKPVADLIQLGLEHDKVIVVIWTDGVFRATNYTLQSLEDQVDQADFAIAIASGDDIVESREKEWPAVRDNVIFELGLFMGRLGRERAILMEPKGEKVKLPSDLTGITTIGYKHEPGKNEEAIIGPAIQKIRKIIKDMDLK